MSELAHLFGDYVAQSDWMAQRKTSEHVPAAAHALTYTACFLPVTRNLRALAVIAGTHFVIDRWRLARYVVWAKEHLAPAEAAAVVATDPDRVRRGQATVDGRVAHDHRGQHADLHAARSPHAPRLRRVRRAPVRQPVLPDVPT